MIITQMREYIEQHGWHRGDLFEGVFSDSAACLKGAWYTACNSIPGAYFTKRETTGNLLTAAIRELHPDWTCGCCPGKDPWDPWHIVVKFNDDEHTTQEDIMQVLKHAESHD